MTFGIMFLKFLLISYISNIIFVKCNDDSDLLPLENDLKLENEKICEKMVDIGDHILLEYEYKIDDIFIDTPRAKSPLPYLYFVLNETISDEIHSSIFGQCENATISLNWVKNNIKSDHRKDNIKNLNLHTFPIPSPYVNEDSMRYELIISIKHITKPKDYKIFEHFENKDYQKILDMIEKHEGINAVNEWGQSALMVAVKTEFMMIIAGFLNARRPKVNVNHSTHSGFTAIYYSLQLKNTDVLKALLRKGGDPNAILLQKGSEGSTPLHFSCLFEQFDHTMLLLEYGADPMLRNYAGHKARELVPRDTVSTLKSNFVALFNSVERRMMKNKLGTSSDRDSDASSSSSKGDNGRNGGDINKGKTKEQLLDEAVARQKLARARREL